MGSGCDGTETWISWIPLLGKRPLGSQGPSSPGPCWWQSCRVMPYVRYHALLHPPTPWRPFEGGNIPPPPPAVRALWQGISLLLHGTRSEGLLVIRYNGQASALGRGTRVCTEPVHQLIPAPSELPPAASGDTSSACCSTTVPLDLGLPHLWAPRSLFRFAVPGPGCAQGMAYHPSGGGRGGGVPGRSIGPPTHTH